MSLRHTEASFQNLTVSCGPSKLARQSLRQISMNPCLFCDKSSVIPCLKYFLRLKKKICHKLKIITEQAKLSSEFFSLNSFISETCLNLWETYLFIRSSLLCIVEAHGGGVSLPHNVLHPSP